MFFFKFVTVVIYFFSFQWARKLRILQHLNKYQHFVESSENYSLTDLQQISKGTLLEELKTIVGIFKKHITEECETCKGNAFVCELCPSNEVCIFLIFSFYNFLYYSIFIHSLKILLFVVIVSLFFINNVLQLLVDDAPDALGEKLVNVPLFQNKKKLKANKFIFVFILFILLFIVEY